MSGWEPKATLIDKIEKHPDADSLSIATVLGDHSVVIRTGEFNEGQLVGYIPIDSIVPDTEEFYHLCPKHKEKYEENGEIKVRILDSKFPIGSVPEQFRIIKAKKIRGRYSMGMLINVPDNISPGDSIIDVIGLKKWEESEEDNHIISDTAPAPKGWSIPYYDIKSIRSCLNCIRPDEEIILSEKLHGANFSACFDGENLIVKSRKRYLKYDESNDWGDVAVRYDLKTKLSQFPMMVFFGELVGQVKGFRYGASIVNKQLHTKLYFFDVWDVKQRVYLNYDHSISLMKQAGLDPAPQLYRGKWLDKTTMYAYANGKSTLDNHCREGWVMKPAHERFEEKLNGRWQVKLVGETYNLSK